MQPNAVALSDGYGRMRKLHFISIPYKSFYFLIFFITSVILYDAQCHHSQKHKPSRKLRKNPVIALDILEALHHKHSIDYWSADDCYRLNLYNTLSTFFDCVDGAFRLCSINLSNVFVPPLCLSQAEMNLGLEHGVPPENIILSGVCKQLAHIKYAAKNNIQHLVCENEAELSKISRLHPNAK